MLSGVREQLPVAVDGETLSLAQFVEVARNGRRVVLNGGSLELMEASRRMLEDLVRRGEVVYGITTGFGRFSDVVISRDEAVQLQKNLVASHATAVGDPFPAEVVRGMVLLRVNALAKGYSGVRPAVVKGLVDLLNAGLVPVVPCQGSLGASGDLVPLAHLALVLTGEGEAFYGGSRMPGAEALAAAGLSPLTLREKEGLALINGTQAMTSLGALAVHDAANLAKAADIIAALTLEALCGVPGAFDPLLARVRPHSGHAATAANIRRLSAGSRLLGADRHKVQDAYSLRCIPQVHGASRDALRYVREAVETEMNAATDNPLLFPEEGKVLSGGNFHGQPVAMALDFLALAVSELGSISERRVERMVNPALSGLPPFLTGRGGLNSGLMIVHYVAASLASENKVLCHPASSDSIPSSANQEDHVSMGTTAARKARQVVDNVMKILGIEILTAAQAADFRDPGALGRGTARAYALLREEIDFSSSDRILYPLVDKAAALVSSGRLVREVEKTVPLE